MLSSIQKRLQREEGFTLIELLVVIIIIGILLAIAVPSYLGFRDRANRSAAQANVRAAIPTIETFFAENVLTGAGDSNPAANTVGYQGMTPALLQAIDAGVNVTVGAAGLQTATGYCVYSTAGGFQYFKSGPAGAITQDANASGDCTA